MCHVVVVECYIVFTVRTIIARAVTVVQFRRVETRRPVADRVLDGSPNTERGSVMLFPAIMRSITSFLTHSLMQGRILYKEDDLIEHVYWLSEGALTVSCEINVIDTASAFNFGTFTANLPPATASGSGAQSRKRFAKLNKVKVLLKGMFALKRVRWSSEVTVIEGMEAGGGLVGKGSRSSLFPDADVRVVLDYVNGPAMVGEFEVIRQDATRRTTVYSASPNTTMYRLCKTLFKVLVLDKVGVVNMSSVHCVALFEVFLILLVCVHCRRK